ncbi:hypothetical protein M3Y98_00175200 [Aphelenchoides besseyi]|nr:hypothetical protein M3Y98_00175200 [Aphelenchoides besseyi]KAI6200046.1 hypothetical protein M3Y96_00691900 [Aphelenchoides besseyi]
MDNREVLSLKDEDVDAMDEEKLLLTHAQLENYVQDGRAYLEIIKQYMESIKLDAKIVSKRQENTYKLIKSAKQNTTNLKQGEPQFYDHSKSVAKCIEELKKQIAEAPWTSKVFDDLKSKIEDINKKLGIVLKNSNRDLKEQATKRNELLERERVLTAKHEESKNKIVYLKGMIVEKRKLAEEIRIRRLNEEQQERERVIQAQREAEELLRLQEEREHAEQAKREAEELERQRKAGELKRQQEAEELERQRVEQAQREAEEFRRLQQEREQAQREAEELRLRCLQEQQERERLENARRAKEIERQRLQRVANEIAAKKRKEAEEKRRVRNPKRQVPTRNHTKRQLADANLDETIEYDPDESD